MFAKIYYFCCLFAHFLALPVLALLSLRAKYRQSLPRRFFVPSKIVSLFADFNADFSELLSVDSIKKQDFIESDFTNSKKAEQLGILKRIKPSKSSQKTPKIIWLHACSFGEMRSLAVIIESILKELPRGFGLLLSTITATGYQAALDYAKADVRVRVAFLPFESFVPYFVRGAEIVALAVFEAEFWLMPILSVRKMGGKTTFINARMSERSFPKYRRFTRFYAEIFSHTFKIFAQNSDSIKKFIDLGAKSEQCRICGNLKLSNLPKITKDYTHAKAQNRAVWVIASTHERGGKSEEEMILQEILRFYKIEKSSSGAGFVAQDSIESNLDSIEFENIESKKAKNKEQFTSKAQKPCRNIIFVPRHPERFASVKASLNEILKANQMPPLVCFSELGADILKAPFALLDSLGELINFYAVGDLCVLGGSFLDGIGGHNPIEPAFFGLKIISGEFIFNQTALFSAVRGAQICDISKLAEILENYKNIECSQITDKPELGEILEFFKKVIDENK